ncbi:four helix bundle protein [Psychrosphaera sp. F3M07]|uniref:four helix bundle protein n=1 Tax=Psychrosphaera sp. F3M07 TaxID=2841560 RepID=UPI001C0853C3|nr:four helix bundle protein [Psychrosphaera sp. F3M07]MBU2917747.1 four helix bundle protein [Psychrosphaera sp. F3M07]
MQFKQLEVWKRSARLTAEVYKVRNNIKDFGYRDQLTRSLLSIPSNITEGEDRESIKECMRYLNIAKGSSAEAITQLYIGLEASMIDKTQGMKWIKEVEEINKMLGGLLKSKRQKLDK